MNELMLQHVWDARHYIDDDLRTMSGKKVEIIYPGIFDHDKGPDFKNARLLLDGQLISRDVEIEMRPENWYRHGHHENPDFLCVGLVVVYDNPCNVEYLTGMDQKKINVMNIGELLDDSISSLLEAGEGPPLLSNTFCPVYSSPVSLISVLTELGYKKVDSKIERYRVRYGNREIFDALIYQGLMESLGYSKNKRAFLEMADLLPFDQIREKMGELIHEERGDFLFCLFLYVSGLKKELINWDDVSCKKKFMKSPLFSMETSIQWNLFRVRPNNHPIKRLYFLSRWLVWVFPKSLTEFLIDSVFQEEDPIQCLRRGLSIKGNEHDRAVWSKRLKLKSLNSQSLIGGPRADLIIYNVFLPILFLYFKLENDSTGLEIVNRLLKDFPKLPDNFPIKLVNERFSRRNKPIRTTKAIEQMGLHYVYDKYCRNGFCRNCPLNSLSSFDRNKFFFRLK